MLKKTTISTVTGILLFSSVITAFPLGTKASEKTDINLPSTESLVNEETAELEITEQDIIELENALIENNITINDIADDIINELESAGVNTSTFSQAPVQSGPPMMSIMGAKTIAAKAAAKQAIKNLQRTGKVAWDRSMRLTVNKLPVPESVKKVLRKYLAYQSVMEVLNIVVNLSGTFEDAIAKQLQKMGMNSTVSGMASRLIVAVLL